MSEQSGNAGTPVVEAEVVELEYASVRPGEGIGRLGRYVVTPPQVAAMPALCVVTGQTAEEAAAAGTELVVLDKTLTWTPGWLNAIGIVGVLLLRPLLLVWVVLYFVCRKRVEVRFSIRRDIRRRKLLITWVGALVAIGGVAIGITLAVMTEQFWFALAGAVLLLGGAIVAVAFGRLLRPHRVEKDRALLAGAGRPFLERADFDYVIPIAAESRRLATK